MNYYVLIYEAADDYVTARAPHREQHLQLARAAVAAGELLLGGAFAEPADGALLVFRGPDESVARRFAEADPYVKRGVVRSWRVRPWSVVVGSLSDADAN